MTQCFPVWDTRKPLCPCFSCCVVCCGDPLPSVSGSLIHLTSTLMEEPLRLLSFAIVECVIVKLCIYLGLFWDIETRHITYLVRYKTQGKCVYRSGPYLPNSIPRRYCPLPSFQLFQFTIALLSVSVVWGTHIEGSCQGFCELLLSLRRVVKISVSQVSTFHFFLSWTNEQDSTLWLCSYFIYPFNHLWTFRLFPTLDYYSNIPMNIYAWVWVPICACYISQSGINRLYGDYFYNLEFYFVLFEIRSHVAYLCWLPAQ